MPRLSGHDGAMRHSFIGSGLVLGLVGGSLTAASAGYADQSDATTSLTVGAYMQARYRWISNDQDVTSDENGFSLAKVRPYLVAARQLDPRWSARARIESELTPQFQMVDASAGMVFDGRVALDIGQQRAPVSRVALTSDSVTAFPEAAAVAGLAPGRQIGALLEARDPWTDWVKVSVGMFNGEGRNQPQNIDESYLFAGRLAVTPVGKDRYAESAFGGDFVTLAASVAHNSLEVGSTSEKQLTMGMDLAGSYHGLAASVEYLQVEHAFGEGASTPDFRANGVVAQATYLLPAMARLPGRIEAGARFDELDRNDTVPIVAPGDENQSLRSYTGVVTYYLAGHALKLSASYSHVVEVEATDRLGNDATLKNDRVFIQLTYRGEKQ